MSRALIFGTLFLLGCPKPSPPPDAPVATSTLPLCSVLVAPVTDDLCPGPMFTVDGLVCARCSVSSACYDAPDGVVCVLTCADRHCATLPTPRD